MFRYIVAFFFILFTFLYSEVVVVEDFGSDNNIEVVPIEDSVSNKNIKKQESKKVFKNFLKKEKIEKKDKNISSKVNKKNEKPVKKTVKKKKKPKLLIIIDDISTKKQINFLKSLPFKVTPSIFPPNKMNMHTPTLAKNLKHYMIHLPLQSNSKAMNRMHKTLFVYNSDKEIKKRVKEIRRLFPNAKYVNNHTGSVFTANYKKSKVLYKALIDNGFIFLDSRTTDHSKIGKIAKEYHKRYLKNDFYLDNTQSVKYTLKQLKKAIALAKKRGYAVVIGHPHPTTFKALKKLKPYLKGIKTVYIDEF